MSEYQEQIVRWECEIGLMPDYTCPAIDSAQKDLIRAEDYVKSICKKCENCSDEAGSALHEIGDVAYALEKLRKENEKLRDYGNFWHLKCRTVCQEFDSFIKEQQIAQG